MYNLIIYLYLCGVADGVAAVIQPKENIALAVKCGFRAVHVFGKLYSVVRCGVAQISTAKCDNDTREVLDGNHQAIAELVCDTAVFFLDGKTSLDAVARRKTVACGVADKTFAPRRSITDVELLASLGRDASLVQILQSLRA